MIGMFYGYYCGKLRAGPGGFGGRTGSCKETTGWNGMGWVQIEVVYLVSFFSYWFRVVYFLDPERHRP